MQTVLPVVVPPSSGTRNVISRVSWPPLKTHAINWSAKVPRESFHVSNTLIPPRITVVDVAGSGSLMRTVTVTLVPSLTGDGETFSIHTVGSDWALASLSAVTSARARRVLRTTIGRVAAMRTRNSRSARTDLARRMGAEAIARQTEGEFERWPRDAAKLFRILPYAKTPFAAHCRCVAGPDTRRFRHPYQIANCTQG